MFTWLKNLAGGKAIPRSSGLGSDSDPIRQGLFASQSLQEQVSRMQLDGTPGPFQSIADAKKLADEGHADEAIARLREILDSPGLETRIELWVWSALRELGATPPMSAAFEVLGAVLEVPSGGAYDTLAGYADGSARYLNYSGKAIFWDQKDLAIESLCQQLVAATIPASRQAKPRESLALPTRGTQLTLLTRSGPFLVRSPPRSVVNAGGALMIELIKKATNSSPTNA